jgi:hypothetical protein
MSRRRLEDIPADELWDRWREDIERIVKDSYELYALRRQFREITSCFEKNDHLQQAGSNLWIWLRTCYASTILMRFRREVDGQANTVNIRTLLEEMEKRPDVITRHRITSRSQGRSDVSEYVSRLIDEGFTKNWADTDASGSPTDQIDPRLVREDRQAFERATTELDQITSRMIAHRARQKPAKTAVQGVDGIFDKFGTLLTKYLALLTGADLVNVEPTPQYDTSAPFTFPWHPTAYREWAELKRAATERS